MREGPPRKEDFVIFLRGAPLPGLRARAAQVMRHLLSDCAVCRNDLALMGWSKERLMRLVQPAAKDASQDETLGGSYDYSSAFAAAEQSVSAFLAPERSETESPAPLLLQELEALAPGERTQRVSAGAPFSTPALVRLLIDRSYGFRYKDASKMLHFADLARIAAEGCSADQAGGEMRLADLRTKAWGQYASALRVGGRPREAEEALVTARAYRERGTGDPVLRAWMLERVSSLLVFQGRFNEAIEMYEEAGQIYSELGQSDQLAGTMIYRAVALIYSGEAERALPILNQAIPLISQEEDPHLLFAARHNLICGH